ncbi:MAG: hypothetical protein JXP34_22260 [Planctomycetes bacterium]|nr:hypothetical protein [Planctomycetota bacterium]
MRGPSFESYPVWMVAVCNAVGLATYAIGFSLMARPGIAWALLYAAYCAWIEWRVLSGSCRRCHYYGKRCGFGRGLACSWFLRKDSRSLSESRISWRDIVPDFLVTLVPLGVGIVMLIRSFSWPALAAIVALAFLGSAGTGLVRGRIACRYCRQRELGCPAEQLFGKTKPAEGDGSGPANPRIATE